MAEMDIVPYIGTRTPADFDTLFDELETARGTSASLSDAIGEKADAASTLAGYGITDAYTKTETDTALASKQDTLTAAQQAAANSGITAEKLAADEAALAEVVDNGAKNLLNPVITDTIVYGVTATVNDGIITLNGKSTNSSGSTFRLALYPAGSTWLSGCMLSGIPANSEGVYMNLEKSGSPYTQYAHDTGNGAEIGTLPNNAIFIIFIRAPYNVQLTNFEVKPMICSKSQWDVSHQFEPYALPNPTLTHAVIKAVDDGAKNLLQLFQLGSSNANVGNPCTSQGVEYEIQSDGTITAYRKSSASSGAYIFLYKNGAIQNVSEFFDGNHIWSGNPPKYPDGGVSVWYKIGSGNNITLQNGALLPNANSEDVQIGIQISTSLSPTQSNPIVFKPMICTAADWAVSQKFVPYRPSWQEMWDMIQALQNGTRYAPALALAKAEPEETEPETGEEETR